MTLNACLLVNVGSLSQNVHRHWLLVTAASCFAKASSFNHITFLHPEEIWCEDLPKEFILRKRTEIYHWQIQPLLCDKREF